jgi:uncharacterized small protein (TIGR04563 family)
MGKVQRKQRSREPVAGAKCFPGETPVPAVEQPPERSYSRERTSASYDPRKVSIYLPEGMLTEIRAEAGRQDRPLSWLLQKAWKIARQQIKGMAVPPGE